MKEINIYQYPSCSTCRKAIRWLDEKEIKYKSLHIVEETPDAERLKDLIQKSGLPLKKFFNTSGKKYRELGLKDKLDQMSLDEAVGLLAADGMLIKRPLYVRGDTVLVGFKKAEWQQTL